MVEATTETAVPKLGMRISVLAWSGFESLCRQVLSLLFFFATVRFLGPADLGVFSLGVALTGLFAIVIDEPIAEALVQQQNVTNLDWDTGYTINLGIAALCLIAACAASPLLSGLLHQPLLLFVIPALAASSLIGAIGNIQKSFLSRSLRFRVIAQTALVAQVVAGLVSLVAAAAGLGYWGLIMNVISAAAVTSVVYRLTCSWKPRFRINTAIVRSRASYVGYSVVIRAMYLLRDQSLFVVAGTIGDLKTLGYLSLAMRAARALGQLFEEVTSRPLISLISRQQNDLARFGEVLQTVLLMLALVAFPSFIGLAELGTPLISLLLGPQWAAAGQFLPWICAGMSGWLMLHVVAVALRARGQGNFAFALVAPTIMVDVCIFASAALIGFDWALRAWAVRAAVTLPLLVLVLSRSLGVSVPSLAKIWAAPAAASALMLLALRWLDHDLADQTMVRLTAMIMTAAIVYGIALAALTGRGRSGRLLARAYRR
jgi:O-antigen/teichoic acid export membrane protein